MTAANRAHFIFLCVIAGVAAIAALIIPPTGLIPQYALRSGNPISGPLECSLLCGLIWIVPVGRAIHFFDRAGFRLLFLTLPLLFFWPFFQILVLSQL